VSKWHPEQDLPRQPAEVPQDGVPGVSAASAVPFGSTLMEVPDVPRQHPVPRAPQRPPAVTVSPTGPFMPGHQVPQVPQLPMASSWTLAPPPPQLPPWQNVPEAVAKPSPPPVPGAPAAWPDPPKKDPPVQIQNQCGQHGGGLNHTDWQTGGWLSGPTGRPGSSSMRPVEQAPPAPVPHNLAQPLGRLVGDRWQFSVVIEADCRWSLLRLLRGWICHSGQTQIVDGEIKVRDSPPVPH